MHEAFNAKKSAAVNISVRVPQVFYMHTDHLNTPRVITNQAAQVVWRWDNQDPFGANVPDEDPDGDGTRFTCNLRFPGQYFDRETNLAYNYFRDYDSSTSRYLQADPTGLYGGINLFRYANQNPLSFSDPLGLLPNVGEAFCLGGPNPICVGGVIVDVLTTIAASVAVAAVASTSGDTTSAANEPSSSGGGGCPPPEDCLRIKNTLQNLYNMLSHVNPSSKDLIGPERFDILQKRRRFNDLVDDYNKKCGSVTGIFDQRLQVGPNQSIPGTPLIHDIYGR